MANASHHKHELMVQSRPRTCAVGTIFVTSSPSKLLEWAEGCVNIALWCTHLVNAPLQKKNIIFLILKYVQKYVQWHYSANANIGICHTQRPVCV